MGDSSSHSERSGIDQRRHEVVLSASDLHAGYRNRNVLWGLDIEVGKGEIVALLGHNGAGKTTALRALCGLIKPTRGRVTYLGQDVTGVPCHRKVSQGFVFLPSEQFTFGDLSVIDNLRLGRRQLAGPVRGQKERLERVYDLFPILAKRSSQRARTLSGGEQRMLSLGIALMVGPAVLLLDEPSLGLAPTLAHDIMVVVKELAESDGIAVLVVEQAVALALGIADRVYVMRSGRVILEEACCDMRLRERFWDLF